tara:strand:+ start:227 stop:388 length:162 start_codon:yes stop_codon:yes gene_type:complete
MKILKEKSREYGGKSYYKHKINIPEKIIEGAGFKDGDELEAEVDKGEIILKKK